MLLTSKPTEVKSNFYKFTIWRPFHQNYSKCMSSYINGVRCLFLAPVPHTEMPASHTRKMHTSNTVLPKIVSFYFYLFALLCILVTICSLYNTFLSRNLDLSWPYPMKVINLKDIFHKFFILNICLVFVFVFLFCFVLFFVFFSLLRCKETL